MTKLIKLLPIIALLVLTLIVNTAVRNYFIIVGLSPRDSYIITMVAILSYILGAIFIEIYHRYR